MMWHSKEKWRWVGMEERRDTERDKGQHRAKWNSRFRKVARC